MSLIGMLNIFGASKGAVKPATADADSNADHHEEHDAPTEGIDKLPFKRKSQLHVAAEFVSTLVKADRYDEEKSLELQHIFLDRCEGEGTTSLEHSDPWYLDFSVLIVKVLVAELEDSRFGQSPAFAKVKASASIITYVEVFGYDETRQEDFGTHRLALGILSLTVPWILEEIGIYRDPEENGFWPGNWFQGEMHMMNTLSAQLYHLAELSRLSCRHVRHMPGGGFSDGVCSLSYNYRDNGRNLDSGWGEEDIETDYDPVHGSALDVGADCIASRCGSEATEIEAESTCSDADEDTKKPEGEVIKTIEAETESWD